MTIQEVKELMLSSSSEKEWGENCDKVKEAHGGNYPVFWFMEIMVSGLYQKAKERW